MLLMRGSTQVLRRDETRSSLELPDCSLGRELAGDAYIDAETRELVREPFDFCMKNTLSTHDFHEAMIWLNAPYAADIPGYTLSDRSLRLLRDIMTEIPQGPPSMGMERREDRYKPLVPGIRRVLPREDVTYTNKAGRAYGFHMDNAWIAYGDRAAAVTIGIYVNGDRTLNNDRYEYESISFPLLQDMGELIARHFLIPR